MGGIPDAGFKKSMKVAPGVGRTIEQKDLIIVAFARDASSADKPNVIGEAVRSQQYVVKDLGDPDIVERELMYWADEHESKFVEIGSTFTES